MVHLPYCHCYWWTLISCCRQRRLPSRSTGKDKKIGEGTCECSLYAQLDTVRLIRAAPGLLTLRHHSPPPDAVVYLGVSRLSTLESRLRGLSEHECNPAGRQLKTGRKIAIKKLKVGQFTGELVIHQSHH